MKSTKLVLLSLIVAIGTPISTAFAAASCDALAAQVSKTGDAYLAAITALQTAPVASKMAYKQITAAKKGIKADAANLIASYPANKEFTIEFSKIKFNTGNTNVKRELVREVKRLARGNNQYPRGFDAGSRRGLPSAAQEYRAAYISASKIPAAKRWLSAREDYHYALFMFRQACPTDARVAALKAQYHTASKSLYAPLK